MIPVRDTEQGATFSVRVQPRARRNAIVGELGDALKVALTAPPVEGKANQACIEFFADLLDVPRSSISIVAGLSSRNKIVCVAGMKSAALRTSLEHATSRR